MRIIFFLGVVFFLAKKNNSVLKKNSALKKNTQTFFYLRGVFFLARMPQILEVVKKVFWAISWAPVGERGVCGDP